MYRGKTIRKLICALVIIALIGGFAPFANADAAYSPFSDVSDTNYFYTEVTEMYEQGVVNGYGDGTFLPQNPVKHSEAIKLVCSMANIAYEGYTGITDPWYTDVYTWAKDNGIISSGVNPDEEATREEICEYIVAVYKLSADTNTDVFSDTDSEVANTLYDYGVIKGIPNGDGTVSFGGTQNVKRCDTCIMLYRLSENVEEPEWAAIFSLDRSHYNVQKPASFTSFDDYVNAWRYMLANTDLGESFQAYLTCTKAELQEMAGDIQNAYYFAMFDYMDYSSFLNQWKVGASYSIDRSGNCLNPTFTLSLSNGSGLSDSEVQREIEEFNSTCAQIVTQLYNNGTLTSSMSVKDKAHVLYVYTAYNTKYDTSYTYYNGYDAVVNGSAVCQGYTAMYNYLCNLAGVPMRGMTGKVDGTGHAWSRIYYNGQWCNVDSTWSDPVPDRANYCDETWFWVTDSFLKTAGDPRTFDSDTLVYG